MSKILDVCSQDVAIIQKVQTYPLSKISQRTPQPSHVCRQFRWNIRIPTPWLHDLGPQNPPRFNRNRQEIARERQIPRLMYPAERTGEAERREPPDSVLLHSTLLDEIASETTQL